MILCPTGPGLAPPLDSSKYWGYTSQWNLLDYPALVFPVTTMDPDLDPQDQDYVPRNEQDKFNQSLCKSCLYPERWTEISGDRFLTRKDNDPSMYKGLPVSLQLVGRRYDDEKVSSL